MIGRHQREVVLARWSRLLILLHLEVTNVTKFEVPVSTNIFSKTNWRILQIIVLGFISMFIVMHHNLARNMRPPGMSVLQARRVI